MTDLGPIADYYATRLAEHGATARGVDWNGSEGQTLRFAQLCRIVAGSDAFSVNDLGCGYGALHDYLGCSYGQFDYRGFDIAPDMVAVAKERCSTATFLCAATPDREADFGFASGIFNVRLAADPVVWAKHIETTLDTLDTTSRRGFAFNCLTSYSETKLMRDHLHYADPLLLFDLCKRRYARDVALLHDYGLFEFTILVRKS